MECAAKQPIHAFAPEVSVKGSPQTTGSPDQPSERSYYRIPRSGLVQNLLCGAPHNRLVVMIVEWRW